MQTGMLVLEPVCDRVLFFQFSSSAGGNKASLCNGATGVLQREKKSRTPQLSADPNIQLLAVQLFQSSNLSQHIKAANL